MNELKDRRLDSWGVTKIVLFDVLYFALLVVAVGAGVFMGGLAYAATGERWVGSVVGLWAFLAGLAGQERACLLFGRLLFGKELEDDET